MNGYQTAEEMKKLKPDVPVILVTGWGDDVDRDRMKEIGIIRVVHKPFQPGELTRTVEEILGRGSEYHGQ
jgi:DNA-binding response OmpR family regulator